MVPAGELYTGSCHRAARRAAETLTQGARAGRVLILSARWGLVELDEQIAPYDLWAGEKGAVTSERIRRQAASSSASALNRHRLHRRFTHLPLRRG
jgi:hypothetical protein